MSRTVLVTGASSGIGAATATLLAAEGFRVWGTSRRPPPAPGPVRWLAMDVRDEASVADGVRTIVAEDGAIDALVCNAGIGIFGSVEETGLDRARAQFETNVFGTLVPVRAVLPSMRARGQGRIVIVGSLAGRATIPFQVHYSATKAAVDALAVGLRLELATTGVEVALIEPGDIKTAFNDATDWGDAGSSAYGERIQRCETVIREELLVAPGPEIVARTIFTALTARRPRMRYPVGPASWLVPLARRLLPESVALRLIRSHFHI
ncbi:MAG TPA: SDR family NAD(P)-dependent oxidoreductase [Candidatus Binatia bacterium]|jgi:NAD(P)-dependent dehydrogenase (short-subunit alcohol dehydrogenase family)|nr:SDR family NAD(P)-dependent oxidoreductase [Candidatus Binatia bacterium]